MRTHARSGDTSNNKVLLFGYRAGYPLRVVAVCVRPRLASGQKIFDIFWLRSKLHISDRNVSLDSPLSLTYLPTRVATLRVFLLRRRAYQAAIICSCNLTSPFGSSVYLQVLLETQFHERARSAPESKMRSSPFLPVKLEELDLQISAEQFLKTHCSWPGQHLRYPIFRKVSPLESTNLTSVSPCGSFVLLFAVARRWKRETLRKQVSSLGAQLLPEGTFCSFRLLVRHGPPNFPTAHGTFVVSVNPIRRRRLRSLNSSRTGSNYLIRR